LRKLVVFVHHFLIPLFPQLIALLSSIPDTCASALKFQCMKREQYHAALLILKKEKDESLWNSVSALYGCDENMI